ILIGVLADKDYRQMLAFLLPHARSFICITPESNRALPSEKLADVIADMGGEAQCAGSMEDGIRLAMEKGMPVLAFGSLYSAGHIRTAFPRIMKALQRKLVLQRRDALPAGEHREASRRICEKIIALPQYADAGSIFLFRAFRSELDLSAVAEQAERDGKIVLYPYCPDKTTMLALRPGEHWETGRFGIEVPVLEESAVWDPAEIDLILCPCTAFDDQGNRLGLGAGYYDRFLPQCRKAYRILTAFEVQHLPAVCTEGFDVGMDAIITESRTEFYDE
ncbi:MAG: 5-formyltetrahydrofolate cyclo-ligase, partial [Oscillospiraceae bacterium]|nr:5-formyltetrahydrofolate cyclo-ligase [Oscillospiraceae bacterium]